MADIYSKRSRKALEYHDHSVSSEEQLSSKNLEMSSLVAVNMENQECFRKDITPFRLSGSDHLFLENCVYSNVDIGGFGDDSRSGRIRDISILENVDDATTIMEKTQEAAITEGVAGDAGENTAESNFRTNIGDTNDDGSNDGSGAVIREEQDNESLSLALEPASDKTLSDSEQGSWVHEVMTQAQGQEIVAEVMTQEQEVVQVAMREVEQSTQEQDEEKENNPVTDQSINIINAMNTTNSLSAVENTAGPVRKRVCREQDFIDTDSSCDKDTDRFMKKCFGGKDDSDSVVNSEEEEEEEKEKEIEDQCLWEAPPLDNPTDSSKFQVIAG